VRERRGPRPERVEGDRPERDAFVADQWIDEGPVRREATRAVARGSAVTRQQPNDRDIELAPDVEADVADQAPAGRQARYRERLSSAAAALDRGRFDDARRMVQPVLRDMPDIAFAHEIAGLCFYGVGQWRKAAAELEIVRQLNGTVSNHAVLADCYRAMRRYDSVEELWAEVRGASPEPALMAEVRIVVAGVAADQGDLRGALKTMSRAEAVPKKVRDYHTRQWYVLGDLYDRSGDVISARKFFGLVAAHDAEMGDVTARLRALGR
jgi:tetratricopeptide (TPR) repeat protein